MISMTPQVRHQSDKAVDVRHRTNTTNYYIQRVLSIFYRQHSTMFASRIIRNAAPLGTRMPTGANPLDRQMVRNAHFVDESHIQSVLTWC